MADNVKSERAFSLPQEQLHYIDRLVAAGAFASPSNVINAGLRALRRQDDDVDRWLSRFM